MTKRKTWGRKIWEFKLMAAVGISGVLLSLISYLMLVLLATKASSC